MDETPKPVKLKAIASHLTNAPADIVRRLLAKALVEKIVNDREKLVFFHEDPVEMCITAEITIIPPK